MNKLQILSSQGKDLLKNLGYGTAIAILFASCSEYDKKENNKIDTSLPIYKGNLIGHGGKGSRDLPIYNQKGQLINYNVGDTAQTIYDHGKVELLDLHGGELNGRQNFTNVNNSIVSPGDYGQTIEDIVITEKIIHDESINTNPAK